jgi:hypothetical protein
MLAVKSEGTGGREQLMDALQLAVRATSLGGVDTVVHHPASPATASTRPSSSQRPESRRSSARVRRLWDRDTSSTASVERCRNVERRSRSPFGPWSLESGFYRLCARRRRDR